MTSAGRFLGTALESTQKAVSLVQEQLGGQGGVLGGLLALTCSIRQNPSADSASNLSPEPRLSRSPAMLPASSASAPAARPPHRSVTLRAGTARPPQPLPLPQRGAPQPTVSRLLQPRRGRRFPPPLAPEPTRVDARGAEPKADQLGPPAADCGGGGGAQGGGGAPGWE